MFDNIARLRFVQGPSGEPTADAMISAEGEMMEYRRGVLAEGKVEDWMTAVLNEMRSTNRLITKEAIFNYCHGKTRCVCVCVCAERIHYEELTSSKLQKDQMIGDSIISVPSVIFEQLFNK